MERGNTVLSMLALVTLLMVSAYATETPVGKVTAASQPMELKYAFGFTPTGIDPAVHPTNAAGRQLVNLIYRGLVFHKPNGDPIADLAEKCERVDPTTFKFTLRKNIKFSDSTQVTPRDVKFSLERVKNPETGSYLSGAMSVIDRIETPNANTVVIKLSAPSASFLWDLGDARASVVSEAFAKTHDLTRESLGAGPFRLISFEPTTRIVLEKNPHFFKPGLPKLDRVVIIPMTDEATRIAALKAGDVDIIDFAPQRSSMTRGATPTSL